MNYVRVAISLFVVILITISVTGWIWTGSHQAPAQSVASRLVLSLGILAGGVGLAAIWRARPTK